MDVTEKHFPTLAAVERAYIEKMVKRHGGNVTRAARSLGVSLRTVQRKRKAWATSDKYARSKSQPQH